MLDASIDKRMTLSALLAHVEAKLTELRAGYDAARDAVLSAPHVMKSKREVFGQEAAYLANALALNIQEREHEIRTLRSVRLPEAPERVVLGCLVGLSARDEASEEFYFLLPVCGGMEVPLAGSVTVRVVTPQTPVAQALLGKVIGDELRLPTVPPRDTVIRLLR